MAQTVVVELSLSRLGSAYSAELHVWQNNDYWGSDPYVVNLDPTALRAQEINPVEYGRQLTTALFADAGLRSDFAEARTSARDGVLQLRLCIEKSASELHFIHWELLRDPDDDDGGFLSARQDILFSRFLLRKRPGKSKSELPEPRTDLRALLAAANPLDLKDKYQLEPVKVVDELNRARSGLTGINVDTLPLIGADPTVPPAGRCTVDDLLARLAGCDILYLVCHGRLIGDTPWILLEDPDGRAARISGKKLVEGISGLEDKPRLIILASCESAASATGDALSALGPRLVVAGVPAVVAMQGQVSMPTIEKFMPVFFRELVRDGRIDRALATARRAVSDAGDWWMPVLYMNMFQGQLWTEPEPAPLTPARDHWVIPRILERPETSFFGRIAELERMKQVAQQGVDGQPVQVMEIWGAGGTGKTALARQLIESIQELFPDGQAEIDLQHNGPGGAPVNLTAPQALQTLLRAVSSQDPSPLPDSVEELRDLYLQRFNDRHVAILLDSVIDPAQVLPFVPPPRCCLVLITSSSRLKQVPDLWDLKLGQLPEEDAINLLLALAPRARPLAAELVNACDRLPQCVFHVGSTLRDRANLPPDFILAWVKNPSLALKVTGIEASFKSSCDLLPPDVLESWRKLSIIDGDFDELTAAAVWGWITKETPELERADAWDRANQRLGNLLDYGMLEYDPASLRYSLLNLVRQYAATQVPAGELEVIRAAYQAYK